MPHLNDAKLAKLETVLGKTGHIDDLEYEWLQELILPFQPERILNGTFDTDTIWTKGTSWSISLGVATHSNLAASDITQPSIFTANDLNKEVEISMDVTGYVAGNVHTIQGGVAYAGPNRTANGTYKERYTVVGGETTIGANGDAAFVGSIDNFSVKVLPYGDIDDLYNRYFDEVAVPAGTFNDRMFSLLGTIGYSGTLHDRLLAYWSAP